jgi:hypothetical protein
VLQITDVVKAKVWRYTVLHDVGSENDSIPEEHSPSEFRSPEPTADLLVSNFVFPHA